TSSSRIILFFDIPPTTETYTLSLHDALPISPGKIIQRAKAFSGVVKKGRRVSAARPGRMRGHRGECPLRILQRSRSRTPTKDVRSEEHTSELQSRENLVCRLLLEKKKIKRMQ